MPGPLRGTLETILVVDGNAAVLGTLVAILKRANFTVLSAVSGSDAIDLARKTEEKIHLLLCGMDMAEMPSLDLVPTLTKTRPDIQVMYLRPLAPELGI